MKTQRKGHGGGVFWGAMVCRNSIYITLVSGKFFPKCSHLVDFSPLLTTAVLLGVFLNGLLHVDSDIMIAFKTLVELT